MGGVHRGGDARRREAEQAKQATAAAATKEGALGHRPQANEAAKALRRRRAPSCAVRDRVAAWSVLFSGRGFRLLGCYRTTSRKQGAEPTARGAWENGGIGQAPRRRPNGCFLGCLPSNA